MYKNVLIICASYHHNNTLSIAKAIGDVLNAKIITPNELDEESISEYDLIGFGSGIYNRKNHESIFKVVNELRVQNQKHAFIFSTSTFPYKTIHKKLKESLDEKGFNTIGEFRCKGFMDFGFTKGLGGFNKGRPNEADLQNARDFARAIIDNISESKGTD